LDLWNNLIKNETAKMQLSILLMRRLYLYKIDNGLSIKPKRLINGMFSSILAVLFLIILLKNYKNLLKTITRWVNYCNNSWCKVAYSLNLF